MELQVMARAFLPGYLPVARWLEYYATRFDTVEINNSFYRLPDPLTFARWRTHVPPAFLFAVKASRFLTHMKRLPPRGSAPSDCSRASPAWAHGSVRSSINFRRLSR